MRILVLDSALNRRTAAVVVDDEVLAWRSEAGKQGHEAALPLMARDVIDEVSRDVRDPAFDLIAVTVGPGSFTGIRAGIALAHGIALALGIPVVGVTVGEAIGDAFPHLGDRALWVVTDSRAGHIFLEYTSRASDTEIVSLARDALPRPDGKVAIAGSAAVPIAAALAAIGANVMLTDSRYALPRHIAVVAARRHAGIIPPRMAQPIYVDPPEARLPAGGLRPPPHAGAV